MASINPDQHKTPKSDNNNQPLHTSTPSPKNRTPLSRQISAGGDSNSSKTSPISQLNKSFTRPRIGSDNFIERRGPPLRPLKQVSQPEELTNPDEISSENGSHSASSDDFKKNRHSPSFLENDQFTPLSTVSPTVRSKKKFQNFFFKNKFFKKKKIFKKKISKKIFQKKNFKKNFWAKISLKIPQK